LLLWPPLEWTLDLPWTKYVRAVACAGWASGVGGLAVLCAEGICWRWQRTHTAGIRCARADVEVCYSLESRERYQVTGTHSSDRYVLRSLRDATWYYCSIVGTCGRYVASDASCPWIGWCGARLPAGRRGGGSRFRHLCVSNRLICARAIIRSWGVLSLGCVSARSYSPYVQLYIRSSRRSAYAYVQNVYKA
jgi:hypothetical protein